ncbi:hypothetical protein PanWU01x14_084890 [Parasponia andersonii]|uniref:Uncharacterized protein n=1 Tax=Parasponia andersonii TaxID=3476 RepID=A0A2P5D9Q9_PARAD|nr:hypothetical protein PanWU01x14_084890 [Parasponia andersonii]
MRSTVEFVSFGIILSQGVSPAPIESKLQLNHQSLAGQECYAKSALSFMRSTVEFVSFGIILSQGVPPAPIESKASTLRKTYKFAKQAAKYFD